MIKLLLGAVAFFADEDEAFHGAGAVDHGADTGLFQCGLVGIGADATHQLIAANANAHLAVHHKANATEHFFFFDLLLTRQRFAHFVSKLFIVGHKRVLGYRPKISAAGEFSCPS